VALTLNFSKSTKDIAMIRMVNGSINDANPNCQVVTAIKDESFYDNLTQKMVLVKNLLGYKKSPCLQEQGDRSTYLSILNDRR